MSFGCEMNCLAELHVDNADYVKSFEKVPLVLTSSVINELL